MLNRFGKKWWLVLLLTLILAIAAFVIWAQLSAQPMPKAIEALRSDETVQVIEDSWISFEPAQQSSTGLIFYPGGRVDARAYAPAARAIARAGYMVIIVPMPLNLAVLGADRATDVLTARPEIKTWAIGGHSLGGAMAARYADRHPAQIQGLVLWASFPATSNSLAEQDMHVLSVYGTLDGLATVGEIETSRSLLPSDTQWIAIQGGNHAQFGWYGPQASDNEATIDRQVQQTQIIQATIEFLRHIDQ